MSSSGGSGSEASDQKPSDPPAVKRAKLSLTNQPAPGLVERENCGKRSFILGKDNKDTFLVGRHVDADCLVNDLGVSRRHFVFKFSNNTWNVTDQKSFNGLKVNGEDLKAHEPTELKDGDLIEIKDQFAWKLEFPIRSEEMNLKLKDTLKEYAREKFEQDQKLQEAAIKQVELTAEKEVLAKRLEEERANYAKQQEEEKLAFEARLSATKEEVTKEQRMEFEAKQAEERTAMEAKQTEAMERIREAEAKMATEVLEREEKIRNCELEKAKLESDKDKLEKELLSINASAEETKAAMDKMLSEHKEQLRKREEEREREKQQLEAEREAEKTRMREQLESHKNEIAQLREEAKRKKDEAEAAGSAKAKRMKTDFLTQCNSELKCSICDELFVEPVSLTCGHVYCQFCIWQWEKTCLSKSAGLTCPNCRVKVTNTTKALQINNLIEALYSEADAELKAERQAVIQERKEDAERATSEAAAAAAAAAAQARARPAGGGRRQPGQQRLPMDLVRPQQPQHNQRNNTNNRGANQARPAANQARPAANQNNPRQRPIAPAANQARPPATNQARPAGAQPGSHPANQIRPAAPNQGNVRPNPNQGGQVVLAAPNQPVRIPLQPPVGTDNVRPVVSTEQMVNYNGQMVRLVRVLTGPAVGAAGGSGTGPGHLVPVQNPGGGAVSIVNGMVVNGRTVPIINRN